MNIHQQITLELLESVKMERETHIAVARHRVDETRINCEINGASPVNQAAHALELAKLRLIVSHYGELLRTRTYLHELFEKENMTTQPRG